MANLMKIFDYTIIGCGLFGVVFAREMADLGYKCQIFDKRDHIGGNVYTEQRHGINVHKYGPHIFHTNSPEIWKYVNRFTEFNNFNYRCKVNFEDKIYSFPINLHTFHQIWPHVTKPNQIDKAIQANKDLFGWIDVKEPSNLEDWIINQVGPTLYQYFIKGYTTKQWGKSPSELPASIIKRLPIRYTYDDRYFKNDLFQGIPSEGYTKMVERMLEGQTQVHLGVEFNPRDYHPSMGTLIWTGPIDSFYEYRFGKLDYRSLKFVEEEHDGCVQGNAVINYTSERVPYTRIVEHKFFDLNDSLDGKTVITKEFPSKEGDPYYPIRDESNLAKLAKYIQIEPDVPVIFGGRLGTYQYYDMDQVIAQARKAAQTENLRRLNLVR